MAIILPSGFQITNTEPVDSRFSLTDAAARKGLSSANVYKGLFVYQIDADELYLLKNSSLPNEDSSWIKIILSSGSQQSITGSLIVSGSSTINNSLYIIQKTSIGTTHQSASLTISASSAEDAILVKINDSNVADKFKINNEGVMVLGSLDNTPTAIEGGIFFSSSNDYFFGFS